MTDITTLDAPEQVSAGRSQAALSTASHNSPVTVMEHAIRSGASPDQLERLLDLQVRADNHKLELMREKRRMDEEDRKAAGLLAFRRDFAAFTGENIVIPKGKFVDRGKAGSFWQAEWGSVKSLLSPALSKHGFSLRHNEVFGARKWTTDGVESDVPWVYVTCYLEHRDGHSERLDLEGPPGDLHANTAVQNMQATGSYLKRQSALAITGTATADEDDETKLKKGHKGAAAKQEPLAEDASLLQAGRDASMAGMKPLTAWWSNLTEEQRGRFTVDFAELRNAARKADSVGAGK